MISVLLKLIRLAVLLFALWGITLQVNKRVQQIYFAIPVVFAGIGSCMFAAGILNILVETAVIIIGLGLWCGIVTIREHPKLSFRYGIAFLLVFSASALLLLYRHRVNVYDDFSHWALVLKYLIANNRFPSFRDNNVYFTSYQIGNLSFIYFTTLITGIHSEWSWFFFQAVLTAAMVLPVFAFCKNTASCLVAGIIVSPLLYLNGGFGILTVDTLLSVLAAAGLLACIYYRDRMSSCFGIVIVFAVYLVTIKTTGILYAAILVGYMLYCVPRPWNPRLLAAAIPFGLNYLWIRHVELVFWAGMHSRHSVSIAWFASVLSGKTRHDLLDVTWKIAQRFFSLSNPFILLILFWLIAEYCAKKKGITKSKTDREIEVLIFGSTLLYELGLWAMYLFSMPQAGASELSSYERYYMTHIFLIICLAFVRYSDWLNRIAHPDSIHSKQVLFTAVSVCSLLVLNLVLGITALKVFDNMFPATIRAKAEHTISENHLPRGARTLLVSDIADYGYRYCIYMYLLDPKTLAAVDPQEYQVMEGATEQYDYILFLNEDDKDTVVVCSQP